MRNFEKLRKWRRVHKAGAIALIVLSVMGLAKMTTSPYHGGALLPSSVMGLIVVFVGLRIHRYSRCPHCGKSVMSPWSGRDGAGRNCIRRIEKRQPVLCLCVHCGEEVETEV